MTLFNTTTKIIIIIIVVAIGAPLHGAQDLLLLYTQITLMGLQGSYVSPETELTRVNLAPGRQDPYLIHYLSGFPIILITIIITSFFPHPLVLRTSSWLCAQKLCLILWGTTRDDRDQTQVICKWSNPDICKANILHTFLSFQPLPIIWIELPNNPEISLPRLYIYIQRNWKQELAYLDSS